MRVATCGLGVNSSRFTHAARHELTSPVTGEAGALASDSLSVFPTAQNAGHRQVWYFGLEASPCGTTGAAPPERNYPLCFREPKRPPPPSSCTATSGAVAVEQERQPRLYRAASCIPPPEMLASILLVRQHRVVS